MSAQTLYIRNLTNRDQTIGDMNVSLTAYREIDLLYNRTFEEIAKSDNLRQMISAHILGVVENGSILSVTGALNSITMSTNNDLSTNVTNIENTTEITRSENTINVSDYASIQAAIDAADASGYRGVIFVPKGDHSITEPINIRNKSGIIIQGEGYETRIISDYPTGDVPARKWPVFDFTGSSYCEIRDLRIENTNSNKSCGCGILHARQAKESSGFHIVSRVFIQGWFNGAALWNAASEVNFYDGCRFSNYQNPSDPEQGGWCAFLGNGKEPEDDPDTLSYPYNLVKSNLDDYETSAYNGSTYTTLTISSYGGGTMQETLFRDCFFASYQITNNGKAVGVMIDNSEVREIVGSGSPVASVVTDLLFLGGGGSGKPTNGSISDPTNGKFSFFYFKLPSTASGQINMISFQNMRFETYGCRHWLYVSTSSNGVFENLSVDNCTIQSEQTPFRIAATPRCRTINIRNNYIIARSGFAWTDDNGDLLTNRSLWHSHRDHTVLWQNNRNFIGSENSGYTELTASYFPNLVYYCEEYSEGALLHVSSFDYVLAAGTVSGMSIHEYLPKDPNGSLGLSRQTFGKTCVIPNFDILSLGNSNPPPEDANRGNYRVGDVIIANNNGTYKLWIKVGDSTWKSATLS